MTDYKLTLNLPKTEFAMKADLAKREPILLKKWQTTNLYQQIRVARIKEKPFIFHDGPPYANGHIHMGTAINKILKDMVVKSKTLSGFNAPFVPGWDCHGLPIELNVEKKLGKPGNKVTKAEFRKACREYAASQIAIQKEEFQRLGVLADWQNPYLTMDFSYEANEIRGLAHIIKNGHLQKGYRPVHWCLDCASALAEAEVEYKDKTSPSIDVRFQVVDELKFLACFDNVLSGVGDIYIPIWTTTPWTLPANQAVALNPETEYVFIAANKERLLIATPLLHQVLERYNIVDYQVLGKEKGESFEKIALNHPFYQRIVPVICGEHVTMEAGTGAVHTAPAHGQDDFLMGKQYQLPLDNPVGDDGCYVPSVALFAGMHVNKANAAVLDILKEKNTLLHLTTLQHSFPHCWRHKTPLIFRATPQWFISMEQQGLRLAALAAIEDTTWVPDWGQSRIFSMIEKRPDWCISRQRTWGVPLPLFVHKETGELHPDTVNLMEKVAERVERQGIDSWYDLPATEWLGKEADHYNQCQDILDVWFDSGVSQYCVLQQRSELQFPADLYLEGSDQHRGWFQTSLLSAMAITQKRPYKTVLTHGYVIDMEGRKMSKSLGNVMLPDKIMQTLGADVLRLWAASVDYRTEINVSEEILARTSETYRRLRNTARFLLANLDGFDPTTQLVKPEEMLALDKWAVDKTYVLQQDIIKAYDTYQFHSIYQKLHQFCAVDLGGFYLDVIKDRQYTMPTNSLARRSAQTAIFHIAEALVRWMAPILSFTAEEIWQLIPGERDESVFLAEWYTELVPLETNVVMNRQFWDNILLVRNAVNKEIENQRALSKVGSSLEADVELYCDETLKHDLDKVGDELRFIFITSAAKVHLANSHASPGVATDVPGLNVLVQAITAPKCERCWHRVSDVGQNTAHPSLCGRCIENVVKTGEVRQYA